MNTRVKLFVWGLLIIAVAGSLAAVVRRQNDVAALRAEHQHLLSDGEEAERLARENQDIAILRAQNEELAKLHLENKDLPRLRNEVRQLRKQAAEMERLRAENQRLSASSVAAPTEVRRNVMQMEVTKESLQDKGLGIPMLTLQTYFAAMCQGNVKRTIECLTPEAATRLQSQPEETVRQQLLREANGFTGYRITERNMPSPDEIVLGIQLLSTGAAQQLHFKQVGNEWKIAR